MMETEEIRKQRRMKFLQKMEAKNKQTQNKYSRSSNSLMNKNIPEQPSPYNANNNTHFDFSNIQSNPNPERAFPHTPTNVNNNKVNDKESNTTNSMYLSKYNTLNRKGQPFICGCPFSYFSSDAFRLALPYVTLRS